MFCRVRMHYGHPDVFDRIFHITRGGISKASRVINISEDIFAGKHEEAQWFASNIKLIILKFLKNFVSVLWSGIWILVHTHARTHVLVKILWRDIFPIEDVLTEQYVGWTNLAWWSRSRVIFLRCLEFSSSASIRLDFLGDSKQELFSCDARNFQAMCQLELPCSVIPIKSQILTLLKYYRPVCPSD